MARPGSRALAACLAFALVGCNLDRVIESVLCPSPAPTPTLVGTWSWASDSSTVALVITADAPAVAGTGWYWVRTDSLGSVRYTCGEGAVSGTYRHPSVQLVLGTPWGNAQLDASVVQLNQANVCGGGSALVGTLKPVSGALPFAARSQSVSLLREPASSGGPVSCSTLARARASAGPDRYGTAATKSRVPSE